VGVGPVTKTATVPCHHCLMEGTRVDRWLWAVRVFKTRASATDACRGGHVRINGTVAKPATPVKVGDRIEARAGGRQRVLEVVQVIDKRVGAAVAAECLVDHSPPPPPKDSTVLFRDPGSGRPTKRERRHLDRFRGR
jgi:ribosome-associated heat shock protein Hsp15